jgi:hypothetical protein
VFECSTSWILYFRLNTNTDIYRALDHVLEHGDTVPTDEMDQRVNRTQHVGTKWVSLSSFHRM